MRYTVIFCVHRGLIHVVRRCRHAIAIVSLDRFQLLDNGFDIFASFELADTFHIFQDKNLWLLESQIFNQMEDNLTSVLIIVKPLALSSNGKWLTREASNIKVNVSCFVVIALGDIPKHTLRLEIVANEMLRHSIYLGRKDVSVTDFEVA